MIKESILGFGLSIGWVNDNMALAWLFAMAITFVITVAVYRHVESSGEEGAEIAIIMSPLFLGLSWMILLYPAIPAGMAICFLILSKLFSIAIKFKRLK